MGWLTSHRIDRRYSLGPAIHPAMIREGIAVGALDLRRCTRCDTWLSPDLWERECPASPLRLLRFWRR